MQITFCTKWKMLPLMSALLLAVAGCGGGGTTAIPASSGANTTQAAGTTSESAAILPVGTALPALPDELSGSSSRASSSATSRSVSDVQTYPGASFIQAAGATVDGDTVVLQSTATQVAWALYAITGLEGKYTGAFGIQTVPGGLDQQYSVGLSNFSDGRWQYFITSSLPEVDVDLKPNTKRLISLLGNLYYVVVVSGGDSVTVTSATLDVSDTPPAGSNPERPGRPLGLFASRGESVETLAWLADPNATSYQIWRRETNGGPRQWDGLMPPPPPQGGGQGNGDGGQGGGTPPPPPPGGGQGNGDGGQGGGNPPPPPPGGGQGNGDGGQGGGNPPPPPPGGGQGNGDGGQGGGNGTQPPPPPAPADFVQIDTTTDTTYVDASAVLDTFYEYQVRAVNDAGESANSNIAMGFASNDLHILGAIQSVSADSITVRASTFAITADTVLLDKTGAATTIDTFTAGEEVALAGVRNADSSFSATEIRAIDKAQFDPGQGHFCNGGELTAIDGASLTVNGKQTFSYDANTKFLLADGTAGTAADFAVGDHVAVVADGEPGQQGSYAKVVQKLPPPPAPPQQ